MRQPPGYRQSSATIATRDSRRANRRAVRRAFVAEMPHSAGLARLRTDRAAGNATRDGFRGFRPERRSPLPSRWSASADRPRHPSTAESAWPGRLL